MGKRCVVPAMESPVTVGDVLVSPVASVRIGGEMGRMRVFAFEEL